MKYLKTYGIVVALLLISASCDRKFEPAEQENIKTITVDPEINSFTNLTEVFNSDYEVIQLESKMQSLIGEIENIIITDSKIFILDSEKTCSAYIFKENGEFVSKLSAYGDGPNSYREIGNFFVDTIKKEVIISQTFPAVLFRFNYDGLLLGTKSIGEYARTLERNSYGNLCLFTANVYSPSRSLLYSVIIADSNGVVKSLYRPVVRDDSKQSLFLSNNFTSFADSTSMIFPFCDTIFDISKDSLKPKFVISFGSHSVPKSFYNNNFKTPFGKLIKLLDKNDYAYCIEPFYESLNYIFFYYVFNSKRNSLCFYSKKTGKIFNSSNYNNNIDQIVHYFAASHFISNENKLITPLPIYKLKRVLKKLQKDLSKEEFQSYYKKNKKLVDIAATAKNTDNPILIIYKIKDF